MMFDADTGSQLHCQEGNKTYANEQILNWLMHTFSLISPVPDQR